MTPIELAAALEAALYRKPDPWRASRLGEHMRNQADAARFRRELGRVLEALPPAASVLELRAALASAADPPA